MRAVRSHDCIPLRSFVQLVECKQSKQTSPSLQCCSWLAPKVVFNRESCKSSFHLSLLSVQVELSSTMSPTLSLGRYFTVSAKTSTLVHNLTLSRGLSSTMTICSTGHRIEKDTFGKFAIEMYIPLQAWQTGGQCTLLQKLLPGEIAAMLCYWLILMIRERTSEANEK